MTKGYDWRDYPQEEREVNRIVTLRSRKRGYRERGREEIEFDVKSI